MMSTKRKLIKLGDVFAIPLPAGRFGFGRRLIDASIAIYKYIGSYIEDTPQDEDYQFIVRVYDGVLISGQWPVIENRSFRMMKHGHLLRT